MDPCAIVARIESAATRLRTGPTVWRAWGAGPPLVLLHGASGSWTHWIRNVGPLAERFRVLAPDLPGFGDSDDVPEPHTAEGLADLVAAGLHGLAPPPATLDLAGFSFGGIVGGLVAARLGPRVRTLVLLGAGGFGLTPPPPPPLTPVRRGMTDDEIRRAHHDNLRILMLARPESADDLAVTLQADNVARARFKTGGIPTSDVLLRALPSIRARIVAIWGARDAFGLVEERRRILAAARPDFESRTIEGAGHWAAYEAADRVNAALLERLGAG